VIDFAGHFHVHDEYSPLDGSGNRNQLSWAAVHAGQSHLGFTNHGRLGGALEHVHACRHPYEYDHPLEPDQKRSADERLIPILGMEAFFRRDRHMECQATWAHHLCVHAASLAGWRTLMRLSSKSWVRREQGGGYYGKPVIDFDMLADDHEDIIVSTACLASPLAWHIINGDEAGAKKVIRKLEKVSKNGIVWLEIMPHDLDAQRDLNIGIVNLAYDMGQPLLATGDVHIPFEDWNVVHQVVRMATYKQSFLNREAKKDAGEDVYTEEIKTVFLSSKDQMLQQFADNHPDLDVDIVAEAMGNTSLFAKQVKWYVVGKSTKAPKVDVDAATEVEHWASDGWSKLLDTYPDSHWDKWSKETYEERFDYEFAVLRDKGVLPYFYIVGDFVRWARSTHGLPALDSKGKVKRDRDGEIIYEGVKRPIRVGLGRGSAAGCLVSYLIGITAVDPIPHRLLFERFLNPDRVGYPDIDIDFETSLDVIELFDGFDKNDEPRTKWLDGRDCIKEYVKRMYGHDHVADIIAYQTFAPRVAIKEVGHVFDLAWPYLNQITESIGETERGLERIAKGNPDKSVEGNHLLQELRDEHPDVWDVLLKLEDQILRDTRHAGGIVITPKPINHYIPTQIASDESTTVTAWSDRAEFPIMADYGFLKYDLLGVKSLAKQEIAVQLIEDYYGEEFEPNDLPVLRDPDAVEAAVISLFERGVMWDIFQFGGRGIQQLLRHIHPENATDISVANALYRPGPIAIAFEYGDRKQGKVPITYWHDSLEPILGETLGLMCFQEQAMEVVKQLAGFSGGDADKFRKIMSKLYRLPGDKAQEVMSQDRDRFIHGCMTVSGLKEEDAASIFDDRMLPLGNYLFNRSHSSSYGLQAVQDAHIKQHWPLAFYASALTLGKKSKKDEHLAWMREGLREARIFDIDVKPPDINMSDRTWAIDEGALMYGLASIEGLGGETVQSVMKVRKRERSFDDLADFIEKMPNNFGSNKIVALVQAGAFDRLEDREELLSRARSFADGIVKFKVKLSCGHMRSKTLKDVPAGEEQEAAERAAKEMDCKHHSDAQVTIAEIKLADDTCEVARYRKDHPNKEPVIVSTPTFEEIEQMELDVLNVSLSASNTFLTYKPFIEARIYTQEEVDELPSKPKRSGKKHNNWCTCDECEASFCVVGGELVNVKVIKTKKGDPMAFADLVWDYNRYNLTFFPEAYREYRNWLEEPVPFFVSGFKQERKEGSNIIAVEMAPVLEVAKDVGWDPRKVTPISKGKAYRRMSRKLKIKRKAS
jgi:DNA polymerase-3 subunit alpha